MENQLLLLSRISRIIETNTRNGVGLKDILIREGEPISGKTPNGMRLLSGSRRGERRKVDMPFQHPDRRIQSSTSLPHPDRRNRRSGEDRRVEPQYEGDLFAPWTKAEMMALFTLIDSNWFPKIVTKAIDRPFSSDIGRLRFNLYTYNGEFSEKDEIGSSGRLAACIRVFPQNHVKLQDLHLPASALESITSRAGMVLLTGGTGVGKSTTAAALLQHINETRSGHIITIENPIEVLLKEDKCFISQREVPSNVESMAQGVQDAMREFPDAILIGEIRDFDAADAAMFAGESGHIVVGTLHSNSAIGCLSKMVSLFPGSESSRAESLSQCLLAVVAQILVPSVDGQTWVPIYETISLNDANIRQMIAERQWSKLQELLKSGSHDSLISMNKSLVRAVEQKRITRDTALLYSPDKGEINRMMRGG